MRFNVLSENGNSFDCAADFSKDNGEIYRGRDERVIGFQAFLIRFHRFACVLDLRLSERVHEFRCDRVPLLLALRFEDFECLRVLLRCKENKTLVHEV